MLGIALVCLMVCAGLTARDAAAQTAGGNGLKGQYYDNQNLTARELTRTDPTVNFSWGTGSPARSIDPDTFSARWTGQVEAPVSGTYTFYTQTSDGVRLWVNGEPLIGKWVDQNTREWSGRISLEAGERYPIKMEYFEGTGGAVAKLLWSRPGVEKRVVPRSRLYLPGTPPPIDGERWSDPATWGGELPGEGEAVTIPADKTVVLDTSPPPLKSLQIDGTLVFDDRDLTLSADWIMVHGKLQIGAEGAPFRHEATISLTGTNRDENVMGMGPKVLGVMGGTLELHGERRLSWTKLGATAARGSTQITLDEAPGWRAGDRIVISSTDYDPFQREEATIEAVSGNVVTLDRALAYTHWGRVQTFDGRSVDERAEVALLSHNVRIEGEEASSADGFGGQIMVMEGGNARLDGVELTRMGQKNILRRYPIHFHMLGDAPGSYLKNSSLHHTFNRCVTVHGTNRLTLQGNVCYDHLGHGYFLEDGAEHDNLITDNLGLLTRRPADGERLLPTDSSPATFWITNPDNVIRGNVAAGSQGMGFWYALPEHPTGLSADANIWPRRTSLSEFSGNVAHSNDGDGLHVDGGPNQTTLESETTNYRPRQDPAAGSPPVVARFEGFVGYKNRHRAVWLRGSDHRLVDATLADNGIGATFASWESMLTDSLVVGETANKGNPRSWETRGLDGRSLPRYWDEGFPIRGYEFYDGRVGAERTTFVNFTPNTQRQASGLGYNLSNAFSIHPKNFASSLSFVDANRVYLPDPVAGMDGDASSVFLDTDGSVTGTPGRYVVVNNPFLLNGGCDFRTDWNAHVCQAEYATLTVGTGDGAPGAIKPLTLSRSDGVTQTLMGCCEDSTNADSSVFTNRRYVVAFNGGTPSRMRFVLTRGRDRWVRLSVDYPVTPKVTKYGCDLADPDDWCEGAAGSLAELDAAAGSSYYYDDAADKLYLKLVSTDVDYEELEVEPSSP